MAEKVIDAQLERERMSEILRKKRREEDPAAFAARESEKQKMPPSEEVEKAISLFKRHKKIIDIGCGGGRNSLILAREIPGADITAFDKSGGALDVLKKKASEEKLENVHILQGDAHKIPAQDGTYGAALSFRVLDAPSYMKMPNRKEAIREMARVLEPGGDALVALACSHEELKELLETFKEAKLQPVSVLPLPGEPYIECWIIKAKKKE